MHREAIVQPSGMSRCSCSRSSNQNPGVFAWLAGPHFPQSCPAATRGSFTVPLALLSASAALPKTRAQPTFLLKAFFFFFFTTQGEIRPCPKDWNGMEMWANLARGSLEKGMWEKNYSGCVCCGAVG